MKAKKKESPMTPTADRFAWSKLQSSPDPKELPIPRFLQRNPIRTPISSLASNRRTERENIETTPRKLEEKSNIGSGSSQDGESEQMKLLKNTFSKLMTPNVKSQSSSLTSTPHGQLSSAKLSLKEALGLNS